MHLLQVNNLTVRFGGVVAIDNLSLTVGEGEIHGLIGPNGAGKTTLFNAVSGRYPSSGEILFRDHHIGGLKPNEIVTQGLARTFQHVTLFKSFSVLKNVMAGCHLRSGYSFWGSLFGTRGTRRAEADNELRAREILDFVGLGDLVDETAANLPHGIQRALGIAVALASEPQMLMLDEPCAGMNTTETRAMSDLIRRIRQNGTSIILIEHDMKVIMGICDQISVLNFGTKIAEGTPEQILKNPAVHRAYLGSAADAT